MASQLQQEAWPYEPATDCSQGFCSIYCPKWCPPIFIPPPPFTFDDDDNSSDGPTFSPSPLVIAIIVILAAACLLVTYYTIISKYCVRLRAHRGGVSHRTPPDPTNDHVFDEEHEGWYTPPSNGLDEALINKIAVCKYRRRDGLVEFTDCSVCLGEFCEDESLRLLPKCNHAFHVQCIDTWFQSHSNCPLCRASIVLTSPSQPKFVLPPPPPPPPPPIEVDEVVVAIENLQEEVSSDCNGDGRKEVLEGEDENRSIRRSFSMGSSLRDKVSIGDILQVSMEDEYSMAKEKGLLIETGSSSRSNNSKRRGNLHTVMSPVQMKRSMSGGRFGLSRQGKGRNLVLPI